MKKLVLFFALLAIFSFIYASYYIGAKSENSWQVVSDPNDIRYGQSWLGNFRGNDVCSNWYSTMSNPEDEK